MKGAFGPFRSMKQEDQRFSMELRKHGERVLRTIDAVLKRKENPDQLVSYLHDLGRKHVTFNAKSDYMDVSCSWCRLVILTVTIVYTENVRNMVAYFRISKITNSTILFDKCHCASKFGPKLHTNVRNLYNNS